MQFLGSHQAAVNRQPAYRGWIMEPKKRETQREPFAVAFGKNIYGSWPKSDTFSFVTFSRVELWSRK